MRPCARSDQHSADVRAGSTVRLHRAVPFDQRGGQGLARWQQGPVQGRLIERLVVLPRHQNRPLREVDDGRSLVVEIAPDRMPQQHVARGAGEAHRVVFTVVDQIHHAIPRQVLHMGRIEVRRARGHRRRHLVHEMGATRLPPVKLLRIMHPNRAPIAWPHRPYLPDFRRKHHDLVASFPPDQRGHMLAIP